MQQKVLQLLENGADIEQRGGPDESSLLFVFVEKRKEALAKLLLGKGADVSTKTNTGETPLHAAAKAVAPPPPHSPPLAVSLSVTSHPPPHPLQVDESMVRLLLAGGADVLAKTNSGDTPLHFAVEDWYTSLVLLLLEHGADASAKGEEGWTPLHIAVERGDEDMVALLLAHKADVTVTSNSGETPLHAISRGRGAARTAEQQVPPPKTRRGS
ncbi:ankyrin repeat-containing domain protein [Baffinella frigidus]|nr:ankyrin repeat-containing domain protein [Cryptophyta sp. CCMP2293]